MLCSMLVRWHKAESILSPITLCAFLLDDRDLKAQFRRRASAVPNLIVIRFDCSTAGKQL